MEIIDFRPPYGGYAMVEDGVIYLSVIIVDPAQRGKGFFRKLIQDFKATYAIIKVPQPSPFLKKVLLRYGFHETEEWFSEAEEFVTVMIWTNRKERAAA